jgi:HK97 family phage major capsid protein
MTETIDQTEEGYQSPPAPSRNPYRNLQELESRQRAIKLDLERIAGIQEPSDEEVAWQGTLIAEWKDNEKQADPLRKRMADLRVISQAAQEPANREPVEHQRSNRGTPDLVVRNSQLDPLADIEKVKDNLVGREELRARAKTLIEQDHKRYELTDDFAQTASLRAHEKASVARHILLTGTEEYRAAFRAYLEDPNGGDQRLRAVNLTAASGGFLLPYVLDPTIVLTNNASANPFRRISRHVTTTSNAWQGVNSAGVTGAWVAEAGTAADNSPTLGQIQLTPAKGVTWVFGSYEALDDTDFGTQLPGLLADARDRLESAAFTTGSGTTQPLGFISAAYGAGNATLVGTTGTVANTDVYALQAALPPRFRNSPKAGWLSAITWINKIRGVDAYGGSSFWANFGSDTPEQLLGKNIYEASDMKNTTTAVTGSGGVVAAFADWDQFIICDRVGVSMLYEPMVKGTAGSIPTGQAGWYMFWRTTSGVATSAAFKFLVNGTAA